MPEFPKNVGIRGIGMTDWVGYACRLTTRFDYVNTFYHKPPRLDITADVLPYDNELDFVLSSDVMEHVLPPVGRAFRNVLKMLKEGGLLVVTVPCSVDEVMREHFIGLSDFEVVNFRGKPVLLNMSADGQYQVYDDLVFHGGPGEALEMRVFSRTAVADEMRQAGFVDVRILDDHPPFGILSTTPPLGVLAIGRKPIGASGPS